MAGRELRDGASRHWIATFRFLKIKWSEIGCNRGARLDTVECNLAVGLEDEPEFELVRRVAAHGCLPLPVITCQ